MARTKTRYRQFKDGGRVDLSGQAELPIEPPLEQPVEAVSAPPEAPAVDETPASPQPEPEQPKQDDATLALRRQIESLRQSEQMRQQAAQAGMPQKPLSREARLAAWRQQGISDSEAAFFVRNPEMLDLPQLTGFAIHKALEAGHPRGTDAHFDFVKKAFDANLAHLQGQANPVMQPTTPTPAFFAPPSSARSAPNPSSSCQRSGQPHGSGRRYATEGKDHTHPHRDRGRQNQRNFAGAIRKGKIEIHNHARRRLISRQPGSAIKCQRHFHHFPGSAAVSYRLADAPPRTGGLNSHGDQRAIRRQRNGQTCEGERQFSKPTSASPRPEHDRHEHWDNT